MQRNSAIHLPRTMRETCPFFGIFRWTAWESSPDYTPAEVGSGDAAGKEQNSRHYVLVELLCTRLVLDFAPFSGTILLGSPKNRISGGLTC